MSLRKLSLLSSPGRASLCKCLKAYHYARRNIYSLSSYVSQSSNYYTAASFSTFNSFKYHRLSFLCFQGHGRNMYIPATPSPLPLEANLEKPVQVGCFDRDERPTMNAPTTNAFQGITGNLETKGKVEEAGGHNHNIVMQTAKHTEEMEWLTMIRQGDMININDLLFTNNRDYLIRNDGRWVKAEELANKLIVVYLVPLLAGYMVERMETTHLIDTYNYLLPHNVFEVVFVAYETDKTLPSSSNINPEKQFEAIFSHMPWTAIPFSDITSREYLRRKFGICRFGTSLDSFVVDSTGIVLQSRCSYLFKEYGGLGYPFTDGRIQYLESLDAALVEQPSLKMLLASPQRDYVISNKGDEVPIDTLEDKVVALYFYEEGKTPSRLTANIELVYEESAQKKKEFEVVLIYLYDTESTCGYTNEESFWKTFKSMPWLALPFKDPAYIKLKRFFGHNYDYGDIVKTPSLVIFGPHGEFIEPWGADILKNYKLAAYPFCREKVAKLETEKIKDLKLEMLWDRNTFFKRNDGTEIQLYELAGKRIILFFEGNYWQQHAAFLHTLKSSYARMEGTDEEFEVIYITSRKERALYEEMVSDVPWLFAHESKLLPIDLSLYCCYCQPVVSGCQCSPGWCGTSCTLAFDRDGKLVSKIMHPYVSSCTDFPFGDADMETEALFALHIHHGWYDQDMEYRGLVINSLQV